MRLLGYYIRERTRIGHETFFRERARIRHERFVHETTLIRPRNCYLATGVSCTLLINRGSIGFRSARRVRDCSGILWRRRRRQRRRRRRQRYSGKPDGSAGTPRKKETQNLRISEGLRDIRDFFIHEKARIQCETFFHEKARKVFL